MKAITVSELFTLDNTLAAPLFDGAVYPFDVLSKIGDFIKNLGAGLDKNIYEEKGENISAFFTSQYNAGGFESKLEFFYEDIAGCPRVILKGQSCSVMRMLNLFYQSYRAEGGVCEV